MLVFELLTAEILAAAAERMVATEVREAPLPTVREFLRDLPWISLVVATVIYEATVAIGILLFVIPGVFVFVAGSLYGPVVVVERCPPWRAGRRSRELVRGSFWRVAVLVIFALVLSQGVTYITSLAFAELPHRWSHVLGQLRGRGAALTVARGRRGGALLRAPASRTGARGAHPRVRTRNRTRRSGPGNVTRR